MLRDRRIQKVLEILERDPSLDVAELAKKVNLSSSRLEHLFKEQLGVRLGEQILRCRLTTAAELLKSTEMTIKEIAHIVGYEHSSSFIRAFKSRFGTIPGDFRQSLAKTANE
jgi:AraC family transcriptional regulator of arabinose operon